MARRRQPDRQLERRRKAEETVREKWLRVKNLLRLRSL